MKKVMQKIFTAVMVLAMGVGLVAPALQAAPVYADGDGDGGGGYGSERAAILTQCAGMDGPDGGNGGSIGCVIELVVNILTILVGIAGVIGIVIVGIQYITAGGSEEQTRKAKRRLFEIVLGLVAYAAVYGLAQWILPSL